MLTSAFTDARAIHSRSLLLPFGLPAGADLLHRKCIGQLHTGGPETEADLSVGREHDC
jgi:hypothetical protein